jgi:hypothetical protein
MLIVLEFTDEELPMPYVTNDIRKKLDELIVDTSVGILDEGSLNYVITRLCEEFMVGRQYAEINKIIGVLECAKMEFYRRVAAPYEDIKKVENGDAYHWFAGGNDDET